MVQRLGEHGRDAARRDVCRERERVGADVRVGRAQLGQAGIAEARLLGEARIAVLGPVDVQEDRPRLHGRARARRRRRRGRRADRASAVSRLGRGWSARPRQRAGIGPEEDLARPAGSAAAACARAGRRRATRGRPPPWSRRRARHGPGCCRAPRSSALVGEVAREAEGRRPHADAAPVAHAPAPPPRPPRPARRRRRTPPRSAPARSRRGRRARAGMPASASQARSETASKPPRRGSPATARKAPDRLGHERMVGGHLAGREGDAGHAPLDLGRMLAQPRIGRGDARDVLPRTRPARPRRARSGRYLSERPSAQ